MARIDETQQQHGVLLLEHGTILREHSTMLREQGDLLREIFGAEVQSVSPPQALAGTVQILGGPYPVYRLLMIAVGMAVALALYVLLERTRAGAVVRPGRRASRPCARPRLCAAVRPARAPLQPAFFG